MPGLPRCCACLRNKPRFGVGRLPAWHKPCWVPAPVAVAVQATARRRAFQLIKTAPAVLKSNMYSFAWRPLHYFVVAAQATTLNIAKWCARASYLTTLVACFYVQRAWCRVPDIAAHS